MRKNKIIRKDFHRKPKTWLFTVIVFGLLIALLAGLFTNSIIYTKKFVITSDNVPKTFVGYKVSVVSNVMNNTNALTRTVMSSHPDIVVVTGNIASADGKFDKSVQCLNNLSAKVPVYLVFGELDNGHESDIQSVLSENVVVLSGRYVSSGTRTIGFDRFVDNYIGKQYKNRAEKDPESSAARYLEYTKEKLAADEFKTIDLAGLSVDASNIEDVYSAMNLDRPTFQMIVTSNPNLSNIIRDASVDLVVAGSNPSDNKQLGEITQDNGVTFVTSSGLSGTSASKLIPEIMTITLSDGTIVNENPLEKFLNLIFTKDVASRFDGDSGFKEHLYEFGKPRF